jgi:hypothetical protein
MADRRLSAREQKQGEAAAMAAKAPATMGSLELPFTGE